MSVTTLSIRILALLVYVLATTYRTDYTLGFNNCGSDFYIPSNGVEVSYTKGDQVPICIVLNQQYMQVFWPQVDTFTLLEFQGSWNSSYYALSNQSFSSFPDMLENDFNILTNSSFHVEMAGWRTTEQTLNKPSQQVAIPFFTILITLNWGHIVAIEYDYSDGCAGCNTASCITNPAGGGKICGVPYSQCSSGSGVNVTSTYDCDLKFYLAWAGLDATGTYMLSTSQRESRFNEFGLRSAYNSAASSATASFNSRL